jgi:AcrR family transcriptional regulator
MTVALARKPVRRTQAQRSATTREQLLNAALDCLVDLGYGATTTTEVAERAGVSRGAQLHHFPTRASLVAAAVEHLFSGLTEEYQRGFAALPAGSDRLREAIALLWTMFTKPRYLAVLELYTAARTDEGLRKQVRPIAERHEANVRELARRYFPEAASHDPQRFESMLSLVLDTMQGMAVSRFVHRRSSNERERLASIHRIAADVLELQSSSSGEDG